MLNKNQTFKLILIPVIILLIYIGGRFFVFYQLDKIIRKELRDLVQQGIQIQLSSLQVGPWKNEITLKDVRIKFTEAYAADTKVGAQATMIQIKGIQLLKALISNELVVRSVFLSEPYLQTLKVDAKKQSEKKVNSNANAQIHRFFIHQLTIEEGKWRINDNTDTPVRITSLGNITLNGFEIINKENKPLAWRVRRTNVSSVDIDFTKDYYTLKVKELLYDANKKSLNVDSIQLIPQYDKATFAQKAGKEVSRLVMNIPTLKATQCDLTSSPVFDLRVHKLDLRLWLESFRDKRYPFKNPIRELPIKMLHNLPITIKIDTINVINSYVEHQEIAEKGVDIGRIFFDKINAKLCNITNQKKLDAKHPTTMHALAQFMGEGDLDAFFTFPDAPNGVYTTNAKLSNFSMPKLNAILEPTAKAKIESGRLNSVKFNFDYNDIRSDGKLEINYSDLKIALFQKDDPGKKSLLKNFIINTFLLKKNMDNQLEKSERTGTILYYRDHHRAIFHYWWQSVFSGFLAALDLKLPEKMTQNKDTK